MDASDALAVRFDAHRIRLRAVAYRMLGSLAEADDAVQESWLRLNATDSDAIENLGGWLTTVVARICLNMLRARGVRREQPFDVHIPDPVLTAPRELQPDEEALLADSVGLALLVVLDTLSPAERLAFVLHDTFGVPFEEIAELVGRSPTATRQLASRARRRVRDAKPPEPDVDVGRQREVVDAFFSAIREGEFEALVALLDPEVVVRIDAGEGRSLSSVIRGPDAVAAQVVRGLRPFFARSTTELRPALVNGGVGMVLMTSGRPAAVMGFSVSEGRIREIDSIADPERVKAITEVLTER